MNRLLTAFMSFLLIAAVYLVACIFPPMYHATADTAGGGAKETQENSDAGEGYINIDFTDKVVVLDSGHGGIDPGKTSSEGLLEKDINLAIAYKLKDYLNNAGIKVVMTRTDDSGLYEESDVNKKAQDMKKRCAIIKECGADIVVSIHQNSFQSASVKGAQVFYYKHSSEGKKLAQSIQKAFKEHLDADNKRVEKADSTYYMLLHTSAPTVIAECGFLSNPDEAGLLSTDAYQDRVAQAIYYGIIDYFTL